LSSINEDVLLAKAQQRLSTKHSAIKYISVGDPLLFDLWNCSLSTVDDDTSMELILEAADGNNTH
jgi:hypothetical protein